jgi:N,N'-diacetyllegionaminate synthase
VSAAFQVAGRLVGEGAPTLVVAEIGANHDGDPDTAAALVDMAAEAGADAVKLQTYTAAELLADPGRVLTWGPEGAERSEPVGAMFDRLALPREAHERLLEHARKLGLIAFSTPFSVEGARFLDGLGVPLHKIASSDLCHLELLDAVGTAGVPVLLSTGKATVGETDTAVRRLLGHRPPGVAVLHCVATYPAPAHELNLRAIPTLAALFPECVVGFSDHSLGTAAALGAVALGARVIEKHVTLDTGRPGPDHWFSADPAELAALVAGIRDLEAALGTGAKRVQPSEEAERLAANRSLVTAADVPAGTALTRELLAVLRPGRGIHPFDLPKVLGLRPTADLPAGHVLTWEDLK